MSKNPKIIADDGFSKNKIRTRLIICILALMVIAAAPWIVAAVISMQSQEFPYFIYCLIAFAAILIAGGLISWRMARGIMIPIKKLIYYSECLASGNTDFKVDGIKNRKDELGRLARAIRNMQLILIQVVIFTTNAAQDMVKGVLSIRVDTKKYPGDFAQILEDNNKADDSFCDLIRNIRGAASNVTSASQQISAMAQDLAQGSTEQASAIEEISSTVGEIVDQTKKNSDSASTAKTLAEEVNSEAIEGNEKMKQLLIALEEINQASSGISNIIKVIEDIAFQTNILALNASVEAARAGVHGKGFAVVAGEVKNLATKSAEAAKETNQLINASITKAKGGVSIGEEMKASLSSIMESINSAVVSISQIDSESKNQVDTIEQLKIGLEQISQVVQKNTATAEESASSSQEMLAQAEALKEMVSKYKIEIETIVSEAYNWNDDEH
jgi:methyl-accepting chemotaxis protein